MTPWMQSLNRGHMILLALQIRISKKNNYILLRIWTTVYKECYINLEIAKMCICVCPYAAVFKIIIFKSIFLVQRMACGLYVEDITKAKDNC